MLLNMENELNKLKNVSVYLSGAIEQSNDPSTWRSRLTIRLQKLNMKVLDPLIKPSWMSNVTGPEQAAWKKEIIEGQWIDSIIVKNKEIRDVCLSLSHGCNMMIVRIDKKSFTVGTWEEMVVAVQAKKPVLILCEEEIPSMWLLEMLGAYYKQDRAKCLFQTEDQLIEYLDKVDKGLVYVDNIKWSFMTY
jgi:hypothetical protein